MVLFSVLCGVGQFIFANKINRFQKGNKRGIAHSICFNLIISVVLYFYYIGYSVIEIKALIIPSWKSLYFILLSLCVGILYIFTLKLNFQKNEIKKIDYNMDNKDKICLGIILVIAIVVRIAGYNWGGDHVTFQPDENKAFGHAIQMAEINTMMSDEINYPSHITHKIISIVFKILQIGSNLFDLELSYLTCLYITRVYIAVISTLVVLCVFLIGNHLRTHVGTVAAGLIAIFPPFVQAAHNATGDPVVALCICLAILLSFYYYENVNDKIWLAGMCFFAAVATLEKYHGMVICGLVAIVIISKQYKNSNFDIRNILSQGIFSLFVYGSSLFLISPNLMVRFPEVLGQLAHLTNDYEAGNSFLGNLNNYFWWFVSHAGILCFLFAVYGGYVIIKKRKREYLVLILGIIEIVGICLQNRDFIRWGYPFYLCLLIVASVGIVEIIEYYKRSSQSKAQFSLVYASIIIVFINNLVGTLLVDTLFIKSWTQDIRNVSRQWCEENEILPVDCIYDDYTCWHPNGHYENHVEWNFVDTSLVEGDRLSVKCLGRNYAIANHELDEMALKYPEEIREIKRYEVGYTNGDGGTFSGYGSFSSKIFEPVNIVNSISMSMKLIREEMYTGYNTYIYDISKIPAYQEFVCKEMDVDSDTDGFQGDLVLSNWILSINRGIYEVDMIGADCEDSKIVLEDKEGNVIVPIHVENNHAVFELAKDLKNVKLKVYVEKEDECFEKIIVKEREIAG